MLRFSKPRDRQKNWDNPKRRYISTKSFNYSEHCFQLVVFIILVWVYFQLYLFKKRLLGSFETAALHRLVRDFIKRIQYHELYKILGGGGGGGKRSNIIKSE